MSEPELEDERLEIAARLQWILATIRPGLVAGLFGYIIQAELFGGIPFFLSRRAGFLRLDVFYLSSPGLFYAYQVIVDMMLALAILAGGFIGLAAINDASVQHLRVARAVGLSLFPAWFFGAIGMTAGGILFLILTLGRGWSWGDLILTASAIAVGLALFRSQAPRLGRTESFLKARLSPLYRNRPLPVWLNRFSLVSPARFNAHVNWHHSDDRRVARTAGDSDFALNSDSAPLPQRDRSRRWDRYRSVRHFRAASSIDACSATLGTTQYAKLSDLSLPSEPKQCAILYYPVAKWLRHAILSN